MHRIDAAYCYRCLAFRGLRVSAQRRAVQKRMNRPRCGLGGGGGGRLVWRQGTAYWVGGIHWRHLLTNTADRSVRSGDAALYQITVSACCGWQLQGRSRWSLWSDRDCRLVPPSTELCLASRLPDLGRSRASSCWTSFATVGRELFSPPFVSVCLFEQNNSNVVVGFLWNLGKSWLNFGIDSEHVPGVLSYLHIVRLSNEWKVKFRII